MQNQVVSREDWLAARKALLAEEKAMTRARDRLNEARRALPWVAVAEDYRFDTPAGPRRLSELFEGRSQLIVYHFMLAPGWEAGCTGCSFVADHLDGTLPHLQHHDISLVAVSRAPLAEIEAYRRRMGWHFPWVSSHGSRFNEDYHVSFPAEAMARGSIDYNYAPLPAGSAESEMPGLSVFARGDGGQVFHTYSSYARGLEELLGTFMLMDRTPLGRNERGTMDWVRRHDEYAEADGKPAAAACCHD
ncbi:thioredoxin [Pseudoroseomonas deserti]|uniref:Thioredoxin n=1 Tax=Teichococcus deserti TaxID=1817963 RepID=A0A1V2H4A8_9PROT|nr:thioredoxin family protein [Pseudoroseomonas deserti]ONG54948.1 thioredoxin [Pseudoroseomonas deserti]